jgi:hypothetical protein
MPPEIQTETLKQILENLRSPERLDDHPWTQSLLVQAQAAADPTLAQKGPGLQLALAVSQLFKESMPATPPNQQGKRLDTRWGEFGLLAAQYFAPFLFGTPSPASLKEAWGRIDPAILLFVNGKAAPSEEDRDRYRLVGGEMEVAPNSTISDWHRKGLERLAALLVDREGHLSRSLAQPSAVVETGVPPAQAPAAPKRRRAGRAMKWAGLLFFLLALLAGGFLGYRGWQTYQQVLKIREDLSRLQNLVSGPLDLQVFKQAGPLITTLDEEVRQLDAETAAPLKFFAPVLGRVPVYGPDLAAAPALLEMAVRSVTAARLSYQAAAPIFVLAESTTTPLSPKTLTSLLVQAQPQLLEARKNLAAARDLRAQINTGALSPKTRAVIEKLDPQFTLLEDGLAALMILPKALGTSSEGPKTYMLLVQNEDELRATGGYITSVGSFVVRDGELFGLKFDSSEIYQDENGIYPAAPWQWGTYMNIPIIYLRDANWSPDFPTSVSLVEYLYAYQNDHSVDGVIAIDQQALVSLLKATGPLKIPGVPEPVTAGNVAAYMREAKIPPEEKPSAWDRKAFIGNLADALLEKLLAGQGLSGETLARTLLGALDQRHLLLQFDDPDLAALAARHGWDGAVRVGSGDFLMSVDTNVGYNKTNALVERKFTYDVDLSDPAHPKGSLAVFHENHAAGGLPCLQWGGVLEAESWYPLNRCYYAYLRVYLPEGTSLAEATPHAIPAEWMMLGEAVPARVDPLDMTVENIPGAQGFGTLLVVPFQQSLSTSFVFNLPARVIADGPGRGEKAYTLKIQKQPGTGADPLTLRVHLPAGTRVTQAPAGASLTGSDLLIETTLATDVVVKIVFALP